MESALCFFCQERDGTEVFSLRKIEQLPKIVERFRNHGFVICDECKRLQQSDPAYLAAAILEHAKAESINSN